MALLCRGRVVLGRSYVALWSGDRPCRLVLVLGGGGPSCVTLIGCCWSSSLTVEVLEVLQRAGGGGRCCCSLVWNQSRSHKVLAGLLAWYCKLGLVLLVPQGRWTCVWTSNKTVPGLQVLQRSVDSRDRTRQVRDWLFDLRSGRTALENERKKKVRLRTRNKNQKNSRCNQRREPTEHLSHTVDQCGQM